ncbi:MAG: lytic murein transglycosylase B [Neisseriaceae bacterium]|nr:lytic murein transglycosylase B [Neisseriaceae bacterium]
MVKSKNFFVAANLFVSIGFCAAAQADEAFLLREDIQPFIQKQVKSGIATQTQMENFFRQVNPKPNIVKILDKPSTSRAYFQFRPAFLGTSALVEGGINFWQKNEAILNKAAEIYGVDPEFIVAIIGVETRYGQETGSFRVADALTTLAFDYPRRADFFQQELVALLEIAQSERQDVFSFKGSYAGAMGWPQFMPSSFQKWAVDFDGDGRRDIWSNKSDIIGSVAHYLQKHGWQAGQTIFAPASVLPTESVEQLLLDKFNLHYTVSEFRKMGVTPSALVDEKALAVLFKLERKEGVQYYYLGLNNFYVITRYNKSINYAMLVTELAQKIKAARL